LRGEGGNCVGVAKGSGTWPEIAGIREKRRRGQSFPKISLKCYEVE